MRRFISFLLLVGIGVAVWFFFFASRPPVNPIASADVWVGDGESGCLYPVVAVADGKDPVWWSESRRQWNQFNSREAAVKAGYRHCP